MAIGAEQPESRKAGEKMGVVPMASTKALSVFLAVVVAMVYVQSSRIAKTARLAMTTQRFADRLAARSGKQRPIRGALTRPDFPMSFYVVAVGTKDLVLDAVQFQENVPGVLGPASGVKRGATAANVIYLQASPVGAAAMGTCTAGRLERPFAKESLVALGILLRDSGGIATSNTLWLRRRGGPERTTILSLPLVEPFTIE
jgi:hypothetical protein